jgi:hypothetical protein
MCSLCGNCSRGRDWREERDMRAAGFRPVPRDSSGAERQNANIPGYGIWYADKYCDIRYTERGTPYSVPRPKYVPLSRDPWR